MTDLTYRTLKGKSIREFAVILFGATGFTGEFVFKELLKHNISPIAIAGRSSFKMQNLIRKHSEEYDDKIGIVIANCTDPSSLVSMCARTNIIINCTGPYRFYGDSLVKAALTSGCHYIDITGEPLFIETSYLRYNKQAKDAGLSIIHSCGFDSLPADLGVLFTSKSCSSPIGFIEGILKIHSTDKVIIHSTTFHALVEGFSDIDTLKQTRKTLKPLLHPISRIEARIPPVLNRPYYDSEMNSYLLKFPGSDAAVVKLSQHILSENSKSPFPLYHAYFSVLSHLHSLKYHNSLGYFTNEGPSTSQIINFSLEFRAHDDKCNVIKRTRVRGPELGYLSTSKILVNSVITLLSESDKIPPGVLTPASAFGNTSIIERLNNDGVFFETL